MQQLLLPGLKPDPSLFFKKHVCGEVSTPTSLHTCYLGPDGYNCENPPSLFAIYFIMGNYNEDDVRDGAKPELLGFDCPFDDSETIYACSLDHMIWLIKESRLDDEGMPDLLVNSKGIIQKQDYIRLLHAFDEPVDLSYFTDLGYSHGQETIEQFWHREKWHFGF